MGTPERIVDEARGWEQRWPPPTYWVKVGVILIAVILAVRILAVLQGILLVVAASLVLAIGLQPAINWLERRGLRRGVGLGIVVMVGLIVVGGLVALVVPVIVSQAAALLAELPAYIDRLRASDGAIARLAEMVGIDSLSEGEATDPETAVQMVGSVAAFVFNAVTVILVTPYFAMALPAMKRLVVRLLPPRRREDFLFALNESTELIANYMVGNLVVSLVAGTVAWIGFQVIGLPFALALAAWVALTDLIPVVGALLGAAGVAIAGAFVGPTELIAALVLLAVYQQVENFVIAPRVMNRAVDLSPAAVIIALMVGGTLAGLVGALLALPVAALVKVLMFEFVIHERIEQVRTEVAQPDSRPRRPRRRNGSRPLP